MQINNMPEYAKNRKYIVANVVDGECWFYGAYDENTQAQEAALITNGVIVVQ